MSLASIWPIFEDGLATRDAFARAKTIGRLLLLGAVVGFPFEGTSNQALLDAITLVDPSSSSSSSSSRSCGNCPADSLARPSFAKRSRKCLGCCYAVTLLLAGRQFLQNLGLGRPPTGSTGTSPRPAGQWQKRLVGVRRHHAIQGRRRRHRRSRYADRTCFSLQFRLVFVFVISVARLFLFFCREERSVVNKSQ